MEIRPVHPEELEEVGRLTAEVYVGDGFVDAGDDYVAELTDAARRAREAEVWVAVEDGQLLGTVTFCPVGSAYREIGRDDEGEFRMLAVSPAARGRGVGRALVELCLTPLPRAGVRRHPDVHDGPDDLGPPRLRAARLRPRAPGRLVARARASTCSPTARRWSRRSEAQPHPGHEPLGVDDHAGHLAGADQLAVLPGGDAEPHQLAVDVDRLAVTWTRGAHGRTEPVCSSEIRVPTLVWPSSSAGASAAQVAASHQASSRGVPSTGRLPDPTVAAVSSSPTVRSSVARQAGSMPAGLTLRVTSKVEVRPPASSTVTGPKVM